MKYSQPNEKLVYGIDKCTQLNRIGSTKVKTKIAILFCSQAAIQALDIFEMKSKFYLGKLNRLGRQNKSAFYWVPDYVGMFCKEQAGEFLMRTVSTPLKDQNHFAE